MKPHEQSQALLNQQASAWVEILQRGRKEDCDAFIQWLTESPRHVRDYMLMETLDAELAQLDTAALRELRITESAAQGVIALPQRFTAAPASNRKVRTLRRKFWIAGVAATLLLIVGAGWLVQQQLGWTEFHTARGEQRSIELRDGSLVHLNTVSRVRVKFRDHGRDIQLLKGEAIFKVRRDAARPFRVYTDHAVVEAIGTQFEVANRQENTVVAVIEGRVRVQLEDGAAQAASGSAATADDVNGGDLMAGDRMRIHRSGAIERHGLPSVADAVAWRQRRLVFHQETLGHIAAEFNRYNRAPQLRVEGDELQQRQYSGAFDADNPQSLVQLLAQYPNLSFDSTADEIVIRGRQVDLQR